MFDRLRLLFAKGTQGVCGGVEEIGVGFQQWSVADPAGADQENLPFTSAVLEFIGGGSISVLRMRDLVEASEIGLRRLLVVKAAALTAVSASLLPRLQG